ncbi:MAG: type VII toxin-antitoxin system HepT family RNase toxin [Vicinamibacterales bacterium]
MMLDADVVRTRCQEIEQSLDRLMRFRTMERQVFLADADAKDVACYRLLMAIEAALALCYHISARRLRAVPEDYAGCFAGLERAGVIGHELSSRLQLMARFRNLLVHIYWTIDYDRVYDLIGHDVDDLREFSRMVAALL